VAEACPLPRQAPPFLYDGEVVPQGRSSSPASCRRGRPPAPWGTVGRVPLRDA